MFIPSYSQASNVSIWQGYNAKLNLSKVTFTGIDSRVNHGILSVMSDEYKFIEWGVLYSPSSCGTKPRYPSYNEIINFISQVRGNMALHLCGRGISEFTTKNGAGYEFTRRMIGRGGRVQLNVRFNDMTEKKKNELVQAVSDNSDGMFILQINENNSDILKYFDGLYNYSVLFDGSGGRGEEAAGGWPLPLTGIKCGYAGGLGPSNLESKLKDLKLIAGMTDVWVDMESKIRHVDNEEDDYIDLSKCLSCAGIAADMRTGGNKL